MTPVRAALRGRPGEADDDQALRAHREGFQVVVVGDIDVRGTRQSSRNIASFDVIPLLDDE
jgi:hypothetical protein